jgi:hypothetical protein
MSLDTDTITDTTDEFLARPPAYRIVRTAVLTPPLVVVVAIAVAFLATALSLSPAVAWLLETALALLAPLAVWFATPRVPPETDAGFDAWLWVALVALSLAGSMAVLLVLVVAGFA